MTLNTQSLISAQDLLIAIEQNPDLIIINVLDAPYFKDCRIKGSVNIPYNDLLQKVSAWDKDKEIVVYCASASCPLSSQAYQLMIDMGFNHLKKYEGGITEWYRKGLETEGSCSLDYLRA